MRRYRAIAAAAALGLALMCGSVVASIVCPAIVIQTPVAPSATPTPTSSATLGPETVACGGSAYFIDSVGGSDGNPGTQALPWQTIAKVNATAAAPGSVFYFMRGDLFEGQVTLTHSGSSGCQISYSWYGSTSAPVPFILGGHRVAPGGSWTSLGGNVYDISYPAAPQLVYADAPPAGGWNGYTDSGNTTPGPGQFHYTGGNLYVQMADSSNPGTHNVDGTLYFGGFVGDPNYAGSTVSYITIDGFEVARTTELFVDFYSTGANAMPGVIIEHITGYQSGPVTEDGRYRNGIEFDDEGGHADGVQILNNKVAYCGGHGNCIMVILDQGSPHVEYNDVSYWHHNAFDTKKVKGYLNQWNVAHDETAGQGSCFYNENSDNTSVVDDSTWQNDLCYNVTDSCMQCSGGDTVTGAGFTCNYYNLTCDHTGTTLALDNCTNDNPYVTANFKNSWSGSSGQSVYVPPNVSWCVNGGNFALTVNANNNAFDSNGALNDSTSLSLQGSASLYSQATNPGFVTPYPTGTNYQLLSSSVLRNAAQTGLVPGMTDIGAYEYGSALPLIGP